MHFVNEHARLLTRKHSDTYVQTSIKPTAACVPVKKKKKKNLFHTSLCGRPHMGTSTRQATSYLSTWTCKHSLDWKSLRVLPALRGPDVHSIAKRGRLMKSPSAAASYENRSREKSKALLIICLLFWYFAGVRHAHQQLEGLSASRSTHSQILCTGNIPSTSICNCNYYTTVLQFRVTRFLDVDLGQFWIARHLIST